MNYQRIYNEIINNAKSRGLDKKLLDGYHEKHHIIPRCLSGDDTENNLVLLTAREHYLCHYLLWKTDKENNSLFYAFKMMSNIKDKNQPRFNPKFTSKQYEILKAENCKARKNIKYSDEIKIALSIKAKNQRNNNETRLKISKANKGRIISDDWRNKISKSTIGRIAWNKGKSFGPNEKHSIFMKLNNPKTKKCKIRDKYFNSMGEAIKYAKTEYKISIPEIRKRFKSIEYVDWRIIQ